MMIDADLLLKRLEGIRERKQYSDDPADYVIRLCEAEVAEMAGYPDRMSWVGLQRIS